MTEHEVPTHVQAEDRVLLWFTFPQIVAMTAVCALAYGAYSYAPVGSTGVRIGLAVFVGLVGMALVVGRIGGRRLPLVAADLLQYRLGARRYTGLPAQLVRSEPPPVPQGGPSPLGQMARRAKRVLRRLSLMSRDAGRDLRRWRKKKGKKERRNGRRPLRPHRWLGKRRKRMGRGQDLDADEWDATNRLCAVGLAIAVLMAAVVAAPHPVVADGHWLDDVEFEPDEPVDGRRLFFEKLRVAWGRAEVTLRAATDLEVRVRALGGWQGRQPLLFAATNLAEGERIDYRLPLLGESTSLVFSWEDTLGQAGAFALKERQLPFPLPSVDGDLCDVSVVSLRWTPGVIEGVLESECVPTIGEMVELPVSGGHHVQTVTAAMDATVGGITGTVTVTAGDSHTEASFVPGGETAFQLPVTAGEGVHELAIGIALEAALSIDIPPLVTLTHHPDRTEQRAETVRVLRPGTSRTVSETVTVNHDDGTSTSHTVSANLSIPSEIVHVGVTLNIHHPEHVRAEVVERGPLARTRTESLSLELSVGSDDPFEVFVPPEPEQGPEPAEQTPLTDEETRDLLDRFGREGRP